MKIKIVACLLLIWALLLVGQQPSPWLLNETTKIQPIVENEEHGEFINKNKAISRSFKLYYKDLHYCTDSTKITFVSKDTTMWIYSVRRMSCEILGVFNVNKEQVEWLESYPINEIIIYNRVTDNIYTIYVTDEEYFQRIYKKYTNRDF